MFYCIRDQICLDKGRYVQIHMLPVEGVVINKLNLITGILFYYIFNISLMTFPGGLTYKEPTCCHKEYKSNF